jgi:Leucine-rich repeat (LRR) protein
MNNVYTILLSVVPTFSKQQIIRVAFISCCFLLCIACENEQEQQEPVAETDTIQVHQEDKSTHGSLEDSGSAGVVDNFPTSVDTTHDTSVSMQQEQSKNRVERGKKPSNATKKKIRPAHLLSVEELEHLQAITSLEEAMKSPTTVMKLELVRQELTALPEELRQMKKLQSLNIRGNTIQTLPEWFSELKDLQIVIIEGNGVVDFPQVLAKNTSLRVLYIGENGLTNIPSTIGSMEALEDIYIANNRIESLPSELAQCTALRKIQADFNHLTTIPQELIVSSLKEFHARRNNIELEEARRLQKVFLESGKNIYF